MLTLGLRTFVVKMSGWLLSLNTMRQLTVNLGDAAVFWMLLRLDTLSILFEVQILLAKFTRTPDLITNLLCMKNVLEVEHVGSEKLCTLIFHIATIFCQQSLPYGAGWPFFFMQSCH